MRIRVVDSGLVGDLQAYLEKVQYAVRVADSHTLEVSIPAFSLDERAERELMSHLAAWLAKTPGSRAFVLDD